MHRQGERLGLSSAITAVQSTSKSKFVEIEGKDFQPGKMSIELFDSFSFQLGLLW